MNSSDDKPRVRSVLVTMRFEMTIPVTASGLSNEEWLTDLAFDAVEDADDAALTFEWAGPPECSRCGLEEPDEEDEDHDVACPART